MGLGQPELEAYVPRPASQIYPARVAALAVAGDRASAATALLVKFPVFGEALARVRQALLQHYGFKSEQIGFVTAFAEPPPASQLRSCRTRRDQPRHRGGGLPGGHPPRDAPAATGRAPQ